MTLDSFIKELERMPIYTTGDCMSDWFAGHSDRILAMAKALKAADEVAAHYDALMLAEDEPMPSSVREYRRLRDEVDA